MKQMGYGVLQFVLVLLVAIEVVWQIAMPAQRQYLIHSLPGLQTLDSREPLLLMWLAGFPAALPAISPVVAPTTAPVVPPVAAGEPVPAVTGDDDQEDASRDWEAVVVANTCQRPREAVEVGSHSAPVYRWVDANGQAHFGDRPANGAEDLSKRYSRQRSFRLTVNWAGWDGYAPLKVALESEAQLMYRILTDLIPARQHRALDLDVLIYPDRSSFAAQLAQYDLDQNTGAFYSSRENRMHIPFDRRRGLEPAMRYTRSLARHEMTHAMTTAMLGSLPMWLSEGLAEYMERLEWQMNAGLVQPGRFNEVQHNRQRVPVASLTAMSRAEFYASRTKSSHYLQAAALVHFLAGHPAGRQWLGEVMNSYADAPCHPFIPVQAMQSYPGGVQGMEQAFDRWLAAGQFRSHQY